MEAKEQQIRYYHTKDGKRPFADWFASLRDKRAQQRIDGRLARVELGNFGDAKGVGEAYWNFGSIMDLAIASISVVTVSKLSSCFVAVINAGKTKISHSQRGLG